ncbi:MAG TPA: hypothetical protein VFA93_01580 [Patescibacteria group bacterium]|nr:hypothetical protein [Patescibacteria group bacterium]
MARKTLKEKTLSDQRLLYRFEKIQTIHPSVQKVTTDTRTLVIKDLRKTMSITFVILMLQIVLFLFLKNHLINLWISY